MDTLRIKQTAYYQADLKEAKAKMAQSKLEKETKKYNTYSIITFAITSIFITVIGGINYNISGYETKRQFMI